MKTHALYALALFAILPFIAACTSDEPEVVTSDDPAEHFEGLVKLVNEGELASAYVSVLPPSYVKDVDSVLSQATALISEPEFEKAHSILMKIGPQLNGLIKQATAGQEDMSPAAKKSLESLSDLPALLGISSYSDFKKLTGTRLIQSFEKNLFKDLVKDPSIKKQVSESRFSVAETTNDYVLLESTDAKGTTSEVKIVKVEGQWVPADLAQGWSTNVSQVREQLDAFAKQKEADPQFVMKTLTQMEAQLSMLMGMISAMGAGGLGGNAPPGGGGFSQ